MTFFRRAAQGTTSFLIRHRPRPGSSGVIVGGFLGSASTALEIIDKGIKGEPMNMWYAVKFLFFFSMCTAQSWKLWHEQPPPPMLSSVKPDPEGHLK